MAKEDVLSAISPLYAMNTGNMDKSLLGILGENNLLGMLPQLMARETSRGQGEMMDAEDPAMQSMRGGGSVAPMQPMAERLAAQGRYGDNMMVHMNPAEVQGLAALSPTGRLPINPETGQPEAFIAALLPMVMSAFGPAMAGATGLSFLANPMIASAVGSGIGTLAETGSLREGIGAGLQSALIGSVTNKMMPGKGASSTAAETGGGAVAQVGDAAPNAFTDAFAQTGNQATQAAQAAQAFPTNAFGRTQFPDGMSLGDRIDYFKTGAGADPSSMTDRLMQGGIGSMTGAGMTQSYNVSQDMGRGGEREEDDFYTPVRPMDRGYQNAPEGYVHGVDPEWNYYQRGFDIEPIATVSSGGLVDAARYASGGLLEPRRFQYGGNFSNPRRATARNTTPAWASGIQQTQAGLEEQLGGFGQDISGLGQQVGGLVSGQQQILQAIQGVPSVDLSGITSGQRGLGQQIGGLGSLIGDVRSAVQGIPSVDLSGVTSGQRGLGQQIGGLGSQIENIMGAIGGIPSTDLSGVTAGQAGLGQQIGGIGSQLGGIGSQIGTGQQNILSAISNIPSVDFSGVTAGQRGLGEQLGGFGGQLGGFGEQLGGFGQQIGGIGSQIGDIGSGQQRILDAISGMQPPPVNVQAPDLSGITAGQAGLSDQIAALNQQIAAMGQVPQVSAAPAPTGGK